MSVIHPESQKDKNLFRSTICSAYIEFGSCNMLRILYSPAYMAFRSVTSVFASAVKKDKIRIHKTIILPVVLYRCET
jgi:hypothetical protein